MRTVRFHKFKKFETVRDYPGILDHMSCELTKQEAWNLVDDILDQLKRGSGAIFSVGLKESGGIEDERNKSIP